MLKRATVWQANLTIDLFREAIGEKMTYENMRGRWLLKSWDKRVKNKREYL